MRLRFSDIDNARVIAKKELNEGVGRLKHWWTEKYNLPENHTLFLERSVGSLNIEMYRDLYMKVEKLENSLSDHSGKELDAVVNHINELKELLDEGSVSVDPLIDKWERELEEGLTPNLEEKQLA